MQSITSKENETIKAIKRLKEKKYREQEGKFIVEGVKMIQEAIQENASIEKIIICEDCTVDYETGKEKNTEALETTSSLEITQELRYEIAKRDCISVPEKVFETLTNVENPQGILAVIKKKPIQEIKDKETMIVILDGIQDPGNLGTILRTIDSTNLSQVILSNKTADPYNPKVVRSTMGAIYRLNILQETNLVETIKQLKKKKVKIVATALAADSKSLYEVKLENVAVVIGNEANGVSKEILELADEKMMIPMLGKTESLNVAVATGVVLYEQVRRRLQKKK